MEGPKWQMEKTVSMSNLPAVLGGEPTFNPSLPMASPRLPQPEIVLPVIERIIRSGQLTKGAELTGLEKEAAEYVGVEHAVGVSSCTSGLMLCLQALRRRLTAGSSYKVAVPSFTFLASVTSLVWAGFEPVFVEVDPLSMNVCLQDLERVLSENEICAVMPVHCFGNPVPLDRIENLCEKSGVPVMFDAAHGFGSIHKGKKVGKGAWCQVFSLTPTKMVVAGEGGIICTDDSELAHELRVGREYGNDGRYDTVFAGLNARLSEMHACLARASLAMLEDVVAHRNKVATAMQQALGRIPGLSFQEITEDSRTTYKDFTIVIDPDQFGLSRDAVATALLAEGVPTRKYFSPPCHRHQAFKAFSDRDLPQTQELSDRCLSLPLLEPETVEPLALAFNKLHQYSQQLTGVSG
jgi:dTDP-4-amino-4,6-dideoxygalactose transaminase